LFTQKVLEKTETDQAPCRGDDEG